MSEVPVTLDLFVEDAGHQLLIEALIRRVARDEAIAIVPRTQSARGGHGRVLVELELSFKLRAQPSDLLVVAIDANCKGWNKGEGRDRGAHSSREVSRHCDRLS